MERGGPTMQGGGRFQNSVTALYLGRLIDGAPRPRAERVIAVRPEAPQLVDDVVVTFADGHREAIQAKDSLTRGSGPWKELWPLLLAASGQFSDPRDRVVIALGTSESWTDDISEMIRRARSSSDATEWIGRLTKAQRALANDIEAVVSAPVAEVFLLFARLELTVQQFEDAALMRWIPRSNVSTETLFSLLRDRVSLHGRERLEFEAPSLLDTLLRVDGVQVRSEGDETPRYRDQLVTRTGTIEVPGTPLSGPTQDLFLMPRAIRAVDPRADSEEPLIPSVSETFDLHAFPRTRPRLVVVAGAGFGKTTLLRGLTATLLQSTAFVPVLISMSAFAESKLPLGQYLASYTHAEYGCTIDWEPYLENGRAVLLLDGMDEIVADRPRMLEQIHGIAGAYPRTAWILTTRDAASGGLPGLAEQITLAPLETDEIEAFVNRYARHGGPDVARWLLDRSLRDPEFRRLIRVPLFLGMVLATGATSTTRAQLLESYIALALQPASHRRLVLTNDYDVLRTAVEALALRVLERGNLEDLEASTVVRAAVGVLRPMTVLEDLVRAGILQRRTTSRPFALPTVQEYLAGCALARGHETVQIGAVRTRPWNQAVQFALERSKDATSTAEGLLALVDDAYSTNLRVVARSIANGAKVSNGVRVRVGDALASWWFDAPSHTQAEEAADLLARGWKHELPSSVLAAARGERAWSYGLDDIVAAVAQPELTLARLRTRLAGERFVYHLHEFQPVVDAVAERALELYLETARNPENRERAEQIASLIGNLGGSVSENAEPHIADERLPPIVRLALALKQRAIPHGSIELLVREVAHTMVQLPILVDRALGYLGWPMALIHELATQLAAHELQGIAHAIRDDKALTSEDKLKLLSALCTNVPFVRGLAVRLVLADLGDETSTTELLTAWDQLDREQQTYFSASLARRERIDVLRIVLERVKDPATAADLGHLLAFAVTYEITLLGRGGASGGTRRVDHPMRAEIAEWFWSHARADPAGDAKRELLRAATELGHVEARHAFHSAISQAIRDNRLPDDSSLQILEDCGQLIGLPELNRAAAMLGTPNSSAAAMRAIARRGTREALEMLIQLQHGGLEPFARDALEVSVERLAAQLGVAVERDADQRLRAPLFS